MLVTEAGLSRAQIIAQLTKSPHGDLKQYAPVGLAAAAREPEFFAHLISWNNTHGQVRDAKVALPLLSLAVPNFVAEPALRENSQAHLALLSPRDLVRALRFREDVRRSGQPSGGRTLRRTVEAYLRAREKNWSWWERTALQHRAALRELYSLARLKPAPMAQVILNGRAIKGGPHVSPPKGTLFDVVRALGAMEPKEAAGTILVRKIPFLVAEGALGSKAKDPDVLLALIQRMTPTELVTNAKRLEKLGVKNNPALRAAIAGGLQKVGNSGSATLKTTKAAEATEGSLSENLRGAQEKQLDSLGRIDGNWLVLADRSPSMRECIEAGRHVATILARMVKGDVHLVFFDAGAISYDATGKTYDALLAETRLVREGQGTSIGVGLAYAMHMKWDIDGIAIISDAQENVAPSFAERLLKYRADSGKEPAVYLYRFKCGIHAMRDVDLARSMAAAGLDLIEFDLQGGFDYYSLPNIVKTMRAARFSLGDEIMAAPLLRLDDVLKPAWELRA